MRRETLWLASSGGFISRRRSGDENVGWVLLYGALRHVIVAGGGFSQPLAGPAGQLRSVSAHHCNTEWIVAELPLEGARRGRTPAQAFTCWKHRLVKKIESSLKLGAHLTDRRMKRRCLRSEELVGSTQCKSWLQDLPDRQRSTEADDS